MDTAIIIHGPTMLSRNWRSVRSPALPTSTTGMVQRRVDVEACTELYRRESRGGGARRDGAAGGFNPGAAENAGGGPRRGRDQGLWRLIF